MSGSCPASSAVRSSCYSVPNASSAANRAPVVVGEVAVGGEPVQRAGQAAGVDLADQVGHPVDLGHHRRRSCLGVGLLGDRGPVHVLAGEDVGQHVTVSPGRDAFAHSARSSHGCFPRCRAPAATSPWPSGTRPWTGVHLVGQLYEQTPPDLLGALLGRGRTGGHQFLARSRIDPRPHADLERVPATADRAAFAGDSSAFSGSINLCFSWSERWRRGESNP